MSDEGQGAGMKVSWQKKYRWNQFLGSSIRHNVSTNVNHLTSREKCCLKMAAHCFTWPTSEVKINMMFQFKSSKVPHRLSNATAAQVTRLSQDNSNDVVVAVVGGEGLHFSIFLGSPWLAKVSLVQDTCKYELYSGVPIFPRFFSYFKFMGCFFLGMY